MGGVQPSGRGEEDSMRSSFLETWKYFSMDRYINGIYTST